MGSAGVAGSPARPHVPRREGETHAPACAWHLCQGDSGSRGMSAAWLSEPGPVPCLPSRCPSSVPLLDPRISGTRAWELPHPLLLGQKLSHPYSFLPRGAWGSGLGCDLKGPVPPPHDPLSTDRPGLPHDVDTRSKRGGQFLLPPSLPSSATRADVGAWLPVGTRAPLGHPGSTAPTFSPHSA